MATIAVLTERKTELMWIVTGANGFIGTNLVRALNDAGRGEVVAVDRFDPPRYTDAMDVAERVDMDDLRAWLDGDADAVDGIYHLGACSDTTVTDRDYVMRVNFEYSQMLWDWCTEHGRPLVYASSAATYGDGSNGFDDQADPEQYTPMNLYGESKHRFDLWALERADAGHAPPRWAGVKYFNVYGPFEQHKGRMASMGYHWFNQVRDTGEARLFKSYREGYADGEQRRDFIYVKDAVDATVHLMTAPPEPPEPPEPSAAGVANGLYNIGTGEARTFADLARAVFAAMGREPKLVMIDMPEDLRGQYQYFTQATTAKLRAAGFTRPFMTVEQGMADYVRHRSDPQ